MSTKMIVPGLLFVLIFVSGFRLSGLGKPYGALLFNAHKLIALGTLVLLVVTVVQANRAAPLSALQWALAGVTVAAFLAMIITGGLANVDKMPAALAKVHHVLPYAALLGSAVVVWRL